MPAPKLQRDQEELDVDQRQIGKLRVQYYNDPAKQLTRSITNEDVNSSRTESTKIARTFKKIRTT